MKGFLTRSVKHDYLFSSVITLALLHNVLLYKPQKLPPKTYPFATVKISDSCTHAQVKCFGFEALKSLLLYINGRFLLLLVSLEEGCHIDILACHPLQQCTVGCVERLPQLSQHQQLLLLLHSADHTSENCL